VTKILADLAFLYHKQRQYTQAEPLLKRSLAITEKAFGPDHPQVAISLQNLAGFYRATNRINEAKDLEKRAASIQAVAQ